jgi:hypothetical protein
MEMAYLARVVDEQNEQSKLEARHRPGFDWQGVADELAADIERDQRHMPPLERDDDGE